MRVMVVLLLVLLVFIALIGVFWQGQRKIEIQTGMKKTVDKYSRYLKDYDPRKAAKPLRRKRPTKPKPAAAPSYGDLLNRLGKLLEANTQQNATEPGGDTDLLSQLKKIDLKENLRLLQDLLGTAPTPAAQPNNRRR